MLDSSNQLVSRISSISGKVPIFFFQTTGLIAGFLGAPQVEGGMNEPQRRVFFQGIQLLEMKGVSLKVGTLPKM